MLRNDLTAGSAFAYTQVTPNNTVLFNRRVPPGQSAFTTGLDPQTPIWVCCSVWPTIPNRPRSCCGSGCPTVGGHRQKPRKIRECRSSVSGASSRAFASHLSSLRLPFGRPADQVPAAQVAARPARVSAERIRYIDSRLPPPHAQVPTGASRCAEDAGAAVGLQGGGEGGGEGKGHGGGREAMNWFLPTVANQLAHSCAAPINSGFRDDPHGLQAGRSEAVKGGVPSARRAGQRRSGRCNSLPATTLASVHALTRPGFRDAHPVRPWPTTNHQSNIYHNQRSPKAFCQKISPELPCPLNTFFLTCSRH